MLTNFELKQLKPKLDIVKKPENRVHELTDSNVSLTAPVVRLTNGMSQLVSHYPHSHTSLTNTDLLFTSLPTNP